ncbi:hypothetical protein AKO1_002982 [Acrasis kona]|uniref:Uncharacterized protein n=1 Tax=Acrasis kona TaxID=1008807 RepID=A0AAW2Z693_9EUKA
MTVNRVQSSQESLSESLVKEVRLKYFSTGRFPLIHYLTEQVRNEQMKSTKRKPEDPPADSQGGRKKIKLDKSVADGKSAKEENQKKNNNAEETQKFKKPDNKKEKDIFDYDSQPVKTTSAAPANKTTNNKKKSNIGKVGPTEVSTQQIKKFNDIHSQKVEVTEQDITFSL